MPRQPRAVGGRTERCVLVFIQVSDLAARVELHQTLGPARTTVTDIADRAGVSRLTVYRHFPDELALGMACSGLYWELHPLPDPEAWQSSPILAGRLRAALKETYAYHRQTEPKRVQGLGCEHVDPSSDVGELVPGPREPFTAG